MRVCLCVCGFLVIFKILRVTPNCKSSKKTLISFKYEDQILEQVLKKKLKRFIA